MKYIIHLWKPPYPPVRSRRFSRQLGGEHPAAHFALIPSLAALKGTIHRKVQEVARDMKNWEVSDPLPHQEQVMGFGCGFEIYLIMMIVDFMYNEIQ